ncbi:hypothetical protein HZS_695 [Henneguya salminicola]|nr:hypothetical protein HZS_695 [Henneguya salminicola]
MTALLNIKCATIRVWNVSQFMNLRSLVIRIVRKGNSNITDYLTFISYSASSFFWILYGLSILDQTIMKINIFGFFCMLIYTTIFLFFNIKFRFYLLFSTACFYGSLIIIYQCMEINSMIFEDSYMLGIIANILSILAYILPTYASIRIIRDKISHDFSCVFLVAQLFCTLSWTFVGILSNDGFIIGPNLLGVLLSVFQIYIGMKYKQRSSKIGII